MNTSSAYNLSMDWSFLSQDEFILDLSNHNLVQCLEEYSKAKEPLHKSVTGAINALKYNIVKLQDYLRITLRPEQITNVFYPKFIEFLQARGLKLSSISNMIKLLACALDWSAKFRARVHPSFKDYDIPKFKISMIALSADDISRIYHTDIESLGIRNKNAREALETARDMFVLSCNLGQRYSDMSRICKDNFSEGKMKIIQQKTKNVAVIDMEKFSINKSITRAILTKYDYNPPFTGDISAYNKHIHQLMKLIFKDEMCEPTFKTGNLFATKKVYKYKIISSHTARRSFATYNYFTRRYSASEIMVATGHTTESSFRHYICNDED